MSHVVHVYFHKVLAVNGPATWCPDTATLVSGHQEYFVFSLNLYLEQNLDLVAGLQYRDRILRVVLLSL